MAKKKATGDESAAKTPAPNAGTATPPDQSIPADLITVAQASKLLNNTHRATIRRWILRGKLRAYTLGGTRWVVSRADVLAMIQPHVAGAGVSGNQPPSPPPTRREIIAEEAWVDAVLKKHGVRK
jgi:excisionase family DNA binding protein